MERTEALGRKKKRASKIYDSKKDKWIENYDTKPKNKLKKKKKRVSLYSQSVYDETSFKYS